MLFGDRVPHNSPSEHGQPAVVLHWFKIRTVDRVLMDQSGRSDGGLRTLTWSQLLPGDKSKRRAAPEETQALPGDKTFFIYLFFESLNIPLCTVLCCSQHSLLLLMLLLLQVYHNSCTQFKWCILWCDTKSRTYASGLLKWLLWGRCEVWRRHKLKHCSCKGAMHELVVLQWSFRAKVMPKTIQNTTSFNPTSLMFNPGDYDNGI